MAVKYWSYTGRVLYPENKVTSLWLRSDYIYIATEYDLEGIVTEELVYISRHSLSLIA
jgi:hypothetical protein